MKFLFFFLLTYSSFLSLAEEENFSARKRYPRFLSEWKIFKKEGRVWSLQDLVKPYELVNPLFTDYAEKFRTLSLPEGKKIHYKEDGTLFFPDGTVLTKTFAYKEEELEFRGESSRKKAPKNQGIFEDLHLIETRVLVKKEGKWTPLPYVWDSTQEDAKLALIGKSFELILSHGDLFQENFSYHVPNKNQCISCHMDIEEGEKIFRPIGPKMARNLNKKIFFEGQEKNQLDRWESLGLIEGLPSARKREELPFWNESSYSVEERARAYLDINCAHCHNPKGSGNTSGLYLNFRNKTSLSLGICKKPVASGNGSGGASYDVTPGDPEHSILYLRMNSKDPSVMMPELGRSLVHTEGVRLVGEWIKGLISSCETSLYLR